MIGKQTCTSIQQSHFCIVAKVWAKVNWKFNKLFGVFLLIAYNGCLLKSNRSRNRLNRMVILMYRHLKQNCCYLFNNENL